MSGKNGDLETWTLLENEAMPKVADTFAVSADPDLVDMGKGIIGEKSWSSPPKISEFIKFPATYYPARAQRG